jgi:hypothetical protein
VLRHQLGALRRKTGPSQLGITNQRSASHSLTAVIPAGLPNGSGAARPGDQGDKIPAAEAQAGICRSPAGSFPPGHRTRCMDDAWACALVRSSTGSLTHMYCA